MYKTRIYNASKETLFMSGFLNNILDADSNKYLRDFISRAMKPGINECYFYGPWSNTDVREVSKDTYHIDFLNNGHCWYREGELSLPFLWDDERSFELYESVPFDYEIQSFTSYDRYSSTEDDELFSTINCHPDKLYQNLCARSRKIPPSFGDELQNVLYGINYMNYGYLVKTVPAGDDASAAMLKDTLKNKDKKTLSASDWRINRIGVYYFGSVFQACMPYSYKLTVNYAVNKERKRSIILKLGGRFFFPEDDDAAYELTREFADA